VTRALKQERRRELAERDARILAHTGPDPEFAGLAEYGRTCHMTWPDAGDPRRVSTIRGLSAEASVDAA